MSETYKNCQSCAMPFKSDPEGGGTNADGSRSRVYCSFCYRAGKFTQPDMTAEGMKDFVKGKLREMGFPGFLAGLFTRRIPKLERWRVKATA